MFINCWFSCREADPAVAAAGINHVQLNKITLRHTSNCCCSCSCFALSWIAFLTLLYLLTRWHWNLPFFPVKTLCRVDNNPCVTTSTLKVKMGWILNWFCTSSPMSLVFKWQQQQFWHHEVPRFIYFSSPDMVCVSTAPALLGEHKCLCHTRRTTHRLIYAGLDHSRAARLIAGFDDYVCSNVDLILIRANLVRLLPARSVNDA